MIREGSYFLNETFGLGKEDSGTERHPAVWQAASGEEVRLIGGRMLPGEAFRPVADAGVLARLDPAARGRVLQADLAALKIPLPEAFPVKFHGASPAAELFFNGRRMTLARWPNEGWATIAKIIDHGSRPSDASLAHSPGCEPVIAPAFSSIPAIGPLAGTSRRACGCTATGVTTGMTK